MSPPLPRWGTWARAFVAAAFLWGASALAASPSKLKDEPPAPPNTERKAAPRPAPTLSPEDQEVVENLELLELLEQSSDLDLLEELSKDD